jgi:hypothetical protein
MVFHCYSWVPVQVFIPVFILVYITLQLAVDAGNRRGWAYIQ